MESDSHDGEFEFGLRLQGSLIRTVMITLDQNDIWNEAVKEATTAGGDIVIVRQVWHSVLSLKGNPYVTSGDLPLVVHGWTIVSDELPKADGGSSCRPSSHRLKVRRASKN